MLHVLSMHIVQDFFFFAVDCFNVFIEFATLLLLLFMFWFFGHEAWGISPPQLKIKPTLHALEGEVLTIGPPGKSQQWLL